MELKAKKALIIDLDKKDCEIKTFPDLHKYVGGVGLGLKLMQNYIERDPIIFCVGPLNGFFPYASKTAIVLKEKGVVEDLYLGGSLSLRIKFSGLDSIIFLGKTDQPVTLEVLNRAASFHPSGIDVGTLGLPGRRSLIEVNDRLLLDNYFECPEEYLKNKLLEKNVKNFVITGSENYKLKNFNKYSELYESILNKKEGLTVQPSDRPSCSNCPLGCDFSKEGEIGGNVFIHSLVACKYAEKIYSDIGISFSCLNILGYDYTHEDLENLPVLIEKTLKELA